MKDTITYARPLGGSSAGGRGLVRVNDRARCPVCGAGKFCRVTVDGAEVWCTRVEEGAAFTMHNDLGAVHVHRQSATRRWSPPPVAPIVDAHRADVADLDRAYRVLLSRLPLDEGDREALARRGMGAEDIARGMYRTLRVEGRAALARAVIEAVGEDLAGRVPGIVWRTGDDGRGWWSLAGSPGVVIPVRDLDGRVVALKVRRRDPCDGARYLYVTSAPAGGPAALAAVHVPAKARELRDAGAKSLVITEGELKADVATVLSGRPVVSVPGVGNWRRGVELARAWGARIVVVAFDADARTNADVARHLRDLLKALRAEGFDARVWTWPSRWKGLDDYLHARGPNASPSADDDGGTR